MLVLDNSPSVLVVLFAVAACGGVAVSCDTKSTVSEFTEAISDAGAKLIVCDERHTYSGKGIIKFCLDSTRYTYHHARKQTPSKIVLNRPVGAANEQDGKISRQGDLSHVQNRSMSCHSVRWIMHLGFPIQVVQLLL